MKVLRQCVCHSYKVQHLCKRTSSHAEYYMLVQSLYNLCTPVLVMTQGPCTRSRYEMPVRDTSFQAPVTMPQVPGCCLGPSTRVQATRYMVHGTWYYYLVQLPGTAWYPVRGTWYPVPGTPCSRYQVPDASYLISGNRCLVPGTTDVAPGAWSQVADTMCLVQCAYNSSRPGPGVGFIYKNYAKSLKICGFYDPEGAHGIELILKSG